MLFVRGQETNTFENNKTPAPTSTPARRFNRITGRVSSFATTTSTSLNRRARHSRRHRARWWEFMRTPSISPARGAGRPGQYIDLSPPGAGRLHNHKTAPPAGLRSSFTRKTPATPPCTRSAEGSTKARAPPTSGETTAPCRRTAGSSNVVDGRDFSPPRPSLRAWMRSSCRPTPRRRPTVTRRTVYPHPCKEPGRNRPAGSWLACSERPLARRGAWPDPGRHRSDPRRRVMRLRRRAGRGRLRSTGDTVRRARPCTWRGPLKSPCRTPRASPSGAVTAASTSRRTVFRSSRCGHHANHRVHLERPGPPATVQPERCRPRRVDERSVSHRPQHVHHRPSSVQLYGNGPGLLDHNTSARLQRANDLQRGSGRVTCGVGRRGDARRRGHGVRGGHTFIASPPFTAPPAWR